MGAERYNESSGGGSVFIDDGTADDGVRRTRVPAQSAFQLTAHPERWRVQGGAVRPVLSKGLKIYPGRQNMTRGRKGSTKGIAAARAHKEERGFIVVPIDAIPDAHHDGDGPKSYLYSPEGRPDVVLDIYTRVFPGTARTQCDFARYYEFLDHLVATGVIPQCPTYVLEAMLEAETAKYERAADRAIAVPSFKVRAMHHEECVTAIKAVLDERTKKAKPVKRARKVAIQTEDDA
jgi:hypothetical protein